MYKLLKIADIAILLLFLLLLEVLVFKFVTVFVKRLSLLFEILTLGQT